MDPFTLVIIVAALVAATKTGRAAVGNGVRSGYKATGWRTPSQAIVHHSGTAGAWVGSWIGKGFRTARHGIATRIKAGRQHLRNNPEPVDADTLPPTTTDLKPDDYFREYIDTPPPLLDEPDDLPARPASDGASARPVTALPAPAPARRPTLSKGSLTVSQLIINIEPPTTDAEFLDDCRSIAGVMRALAEEIGEWASGVAALGIPQEVTNPLAGIADGLTAAADGAMQAATRFEDSFEEAREVAARGMTITGQDAA
ncbi:hypothetical protein ACIBG8_46845 [Nonomuraea sp. NPDC050556]|uniref:hypothetical protein n=1 Tax=Nonomuraea sp. NPDC050556 TaxID=3364369 RepID=UPI0037886CE2